MKIFDKNFSEYLKASKKFLLLTFLLMAVISAARLFLNYSSGILDLAFALVILIWAGWTMTRKNNFILIQTGVVGVLVSFMTIWALFIFDPIKDIPKIVAVNAVIYGLVAMLG